MKYLKKYENYNQNIYIYHYTMIERAISIINDGKLKQREYGITNKYSNSYESEDYGYISFTEDSEFHETTSDIPVEVRLVFDKTKLEKDYELVPFSFDERKQHYLQSEYKDDDIDIVLANEEWFGDESELRIYNKDVPIKKYLVAVEIVEGSIPEEENQLKVLCNENNIEFRNEIS